MKSFTGKNVLIWGLVTPITYVSLKTVLIGLGFQTVPSLFACAVIIAIAIGAKP
jgi:hypothetical protein